MLKAAKACFANIVEVTGTIIPREENQVRPDRMGLKVAEVMVDAGDTVTAGQVRARLTLPEGGQISVQAPVAGIISATTASVGALASGLSGRGRLPETAAILEALFGMLAPAQDLAGETFVVTAGPTREPIDPVRYISNRSSGKMGYRLALAALRRGARVTLISGPTALTQPPAATFVPVQTAEEMREAVLQHLPGATVVVKAAAVADYRVRRPAEAKIKGKRDLTLELTPNPDILAEVAATRTGAFVVGFAAETHDVAANARAKLEAKGIDLLVANDVSQAGIGFDAEDNEVLLIDRWGGTRALPRMSKSAVADEILSEIVRLRAAAHRAAGKAAR